MNEGFRKLEDLTDARMTRTGESREQAQVEVLRSAEGKRAYHLYKSGPHEAPTLEGIAREELAIHASRLIRDAGGAIAKADAVDEIMERYPDLARLANGGARINKGDDAWQEFVTAADAWVAKSSDPSIDEEHRVDAFLKTHAGKVAYSKYVAARGA